MPGGEAQDFRDTLLSVGGTSNPHSGTLILPPGAFLLLSVAFILSRGTFDLSSGTLILCRRAFILSCETFDLSRGTLILPCRTFRGTG
jgi:hypothetical protein